VANKDHDAQFTWASERHLRLALGQADSPQAHACVRRATVALERAGLRGLVGITPAYATILLESDLGQLDVERTVAAVRRAITESIEIAAEARPHAVNIPVCYEGHCAPDAADVARMHDIDVDELIRRHSEPLYLVQFIGFAPGFGYLSGLPRQIATPRLPSPRVRVPVGSVGIAEEQTGVYATPGAGGWRLIGRTPLVMFDARRESPALLAPGDRVRFMPISPSEFEAQWRGREVDA
jgi:KipI family sensor histidine kinase inhibitor